MSHLHRLFLSHLTTKLPKHAKKHQQHLSNPPFNSPSSPQRTIPFLPDTLPAPIQYLITREYTCSIHESLSMAKMHRMWREGREELDNKFGGMEYGGMDHGGIRNGNEELSDTLLPAKLPYTSLLDMFTTLYPSIPWPQYLPIRWLRHSEVIIHLPTLIPRIERELRVSSPEEWLRLSERDFDAILAKKIRTMYLAELVRALRERYPEREWDVREFGIRNKKSVQRQLLKCVEELFPNDTIHEEKRVEVRGASHAPQQHTALYEADIYVEEHSLLIDYHGEQHYQFIDGFSSKELEKRVSRDEEKRQLFRQNGYTYVSVPYWWDRNVDSLKETLRQANPNLFPKQSPTGLPISPLPPQSIHSAPALAYPLDWDRTTDLTDWWQSSLYDSLRVVFSMDPNVEPLLQTPEGHVVNLPPRLLNQIPRGYTLDGELYSSFGLQYIVSLLHIDDEDTPEWDNVQFLIRDLADSDRTFEERQEMLRNLLGDSPSSFVRLCEYTQIASNNHFQHILQSLSPQQFAGDVQALLLKKPHSLYTSGFSSDYLIGKPHFFTQALLLQKTTKAGQMCRVRLLNGKELEIRAPSTLRDDLQNLEDEKSVLNVKFSHVDRSSGSLVDARIVSINTQDTWEQLQHNFDTQGDSLLTPTDSAPTLRSALQWALHYHHPTLSLRDIRQKLSHDNQIQLLEAAIEKCAYIFATHEERLWLYSLFSLSRDEFDRQLKRAKQKKRNPAGDITESAKEQIRQWFKENGNATPNTIQKNHLQRLTGLSRMQLNTQIQYLREEGREITSQIKARLEEWMKTHNYRSPTSEEYDELQRDTQLSRSQLYTQVKLLKTPRQEVQQEHRDTLLDWLKAHSFTLPDAQQRDELQDLTGLSRNQINQQLNYLMAHHSPQADSRTTKEFVRQWLQDNDYRTPTKEEFEWLLERTGWKRRLLKDQLAMMTPMRV